MTDMIRSPRMAGDIVRKARLARNVTQDALASRMRVRQATVSKLEADESATRMEVFFDALAALGLEFVIAERSLDSTPVRFGSILHADHPRKWVIFACRSTINANCSSGSAAACK